MATPQAFKRLTKEYSLLSNNPIPFITAKPLDNNILEWHYVITGPKDSFYEHGEYHGKLIFPPDYPYKPPAIKIITPNGRFITNQRLCLSMSDFHPQSWNPAWSVSTILTGLLSFMLESTPTTGSIETTSHQKKLYAQQSYSFNRNNPKFRQVFPELLQAQLTIPTLPLESLPTSNGSTDKSNALPATNIPIIYWFSTLVFAIVVYLIASKIAVKLN